eukprot:TRINITY_DN10810_c0_g1_i1.p1 TRINITY_DN10810_c0_g1~~TRINITY_DN10810_c0_g1_i1.p1  ORF type:complete len:269 (-),score=21.04 TRINITY_DN10810_c0_g1_i1:60-866(-)
MCIRDSPNRKGLVTGILFCFSGLAISFFSLLSQHLVNPLNLKATITDISENTTHNYFDKRVTDRVPYMLRTLSMIYLCLGWLGAYMLHYERVYPIENDPFYYKKELSTNFKEGFQLRYFFLQKKQFWLLYLFNFFAGFPLQYVIFCFKSYGIDVFNRDGFITVIASLGSFANAIARLIGGYLFDRIGYKKTIFIIVVIEILLMGTLALVKNIYLFLVWIVVLEYCYGALLVKMPAISAKVFGQKGGASAYPVLKTAFTLVQLLSLIHI